MTRARAISRSVAGCIARRRRRGEIWPPPQQQPFDALFPPDTRCCAARAPGIRSASPGSTIIRSQLVRSPKIRRKPFVQSSRRNEWVAPFVQYLVDDTPLFDSSSSLTSRGQPAPGGCVLARPRSHLRVTGQNQLCSSCGARIGSAKKTPGSASRKNTCFYEPQTQLVLLILRTCVLALIN